jgi:uncharacterized protein YqgV (UPF0045/DUF77 family)
MAGKSLQIDDDYCEKMKQYYVAQGTKIESYLSEYISILESISKTAIKKGDVHVSLKNYISYAKKLKGQVTNVSKTAQTQVTNFLKQVDDADQYLF